LTLWKRFSASGPTDWTDALQHCSKWKVGGMKQTMAYCVILDRAQIWRCSSHREKPNQMMLKFRTRWRSYSFRFRCAVPCDQEG
jgi:hypothetical protein